MKEFNKAQSAGSAKTTVTRMFSGKSGSVADWKKGSQASSGTADTGDTMVEEVTAGCACTIT